MNRFVISCIALLVVLPPLAAQDKLGHPRITGVHHVRIYVSDIAKSRSFYGDVLGLPLADYRCEQKFRSCFAINWGPTKQYVELEQAPSPAPKNWLAEIALATDDVTKLRQFLLAHGVETGPISKGADYTQHFDLRDPEGNLISFVGSYELPVDDPPYYEAVGKDLIHAGLVVKDRVAMDHFYKDILGFHVYWHGGMKDDETNWVDMQVLDATDWIEYMLNVPANADKHTLGVMNHIALGVPDIHAAQQQLIKNGWKGNEQPKIGRDGKWQLNLYDPDDTRVELMEFTPVEKPCCSEYTGPHPKP
jgi:catechol 2,3-dioxygenase-like lactoylglutathione lyase family enzyme